MYSSMLHELKKESSPHTLIKISFRVFVFAQHLQQHDEIKVGVNNLPDQSNSVTQNAGNYLQQQTMNNLGSYYLLSFTYALNKNLNPMITAEGDGGMRMMIRN